MNFIQRTTAGITWEAGLATMNKESVDSIKASIADSDLQPGNTKLPLTVYSRAPSHM